MRTLSVAAPFVLMLGVFGCAGDPTGLTREEAREVAILVKGREEVPGFKQLALADTVKREIPSETTAWLVRSRVEYARRPRSETERKRRPGDWCVLVWLSRDEPRLADFAWAELLPVVSIGAYTALSDRCAKAEYLVGPLPPLTDGN